MPPMTSVVLPSIINDAATLYNGFREHTGTSLLFQSFRILVEPLVTFLPEHPSEGNIKRILLTNLLFQMGHYIVHLNVS